LRARVAGEVASRLGLSSLPPRSVLLALANAEASGLHFLHAHLEHLAREQYPQTASAEGLARWAQLAGVTRKAATFARGNAVFAGNPGSPVPNGTLITRGDGQTYKTRSSATIGASGTVSVLVLAQASGALGNSTVGTALSLGVTLAGVSGTATVDDAGLTGGFDAETDEALRARVLEALAAPVLGGSPSDWVTWALQIPGVTRAWCFPLIQGPGTVGVTFVVDDASYGPIPNPTDVAAAQAYLETFRPAGVPVLYVFAPNELPLNLTLTLLPDSPELRTEVEASVRDLLRREAAPGVPLLLTHLQEAISLAVGEEDHVLSAPSANVSGGPADLITIGTISYV
jgi:uncharacterized phage protein gp47/JayE